MILYAEDGWDKGKIISIIELKQSIKEYAFILNNHAFVGNGYIDIKGNKIDLKKDVEQGIDISKVKVTANGTLDKDTGIITVDDVKKPVTYELVISDCYWCCLERF